VPREYAQWKRPAFEQAFASLRHSLDSKDHLRRLDAALALAAALPAVGTERVRGST
jgi:hypothetical protein